MLKKLFQLYRHYKLYKAGLITGKHCRLNETRIKFSSNTVVQIGDLCNINCIISCGKNNAKVLIGNETFIGHSTIISSELIKIGNNVLISSKCYITDTDGHSFDYLIRKEDVKNRIFKGKKDWSSIESKPVEIQDYAWIGHGSYILKGVSIGTGAIVGANSVITKDVEPWTIVGGNPAKTIRKLNMK
jgi:acetyltransferase-like isoleucine patch superfamily enzyme